MKHTIFRISALCLLLTGSAHAWGPEGHIIVGRIAAEHLSPKASKQIRLLLGTNITGLGADEIANWADQIRQERPETVHWHFVDIPLEAKKYKAERDCPKDHGCVIEAIAQYRRILGDKTATKEARLEALKFLVHFIGDLHQPLHCAERNKDQGGNRCYVQWPGEAKPVRLHAVWDSHLLEQSLRNARVKPLDYAEHLNSLITPEQLKAWGRGTPLDWAWEGHDLAAEKVYPSIPVEEAGAELSAEYIKAGQAVVIEQLERAGIRLAAVLNESLR